MFPNSVFISSNIFRIVQRIKVNNKNYCGIMGNYCRMDPFSTLIVNSIAPNSSIEKCCLDCVHWYTGSDELSL